MIVLFVAKSKSGKISTLISDQAESLRREGVIVDIFKITNSGIKSILTTYRNLRLFIKKHNPDLVHAHYGLTGFLTLLAFGGKPVIISYMGSDLLGERTINGVISLRSRVVVLLSLCSQYFANKIIVKSTNLWDKISRHNKTYIIPNGVDMHLFKYEEMHASKTKLGLDSQVNYILFANNPDDPWKNFKLAENAVEELKDLRIKLLVPYPVQHERIVTYINASMVFILTSYAEGSPNVIKEAMACGCPVVSTDVGDAKKVVDETDGYFISSFDPRDFARKIEKAISFRRQYNQTMGRERILELGLDSASVAKKLIKVYKEVLTK